MTSAITIEAQKAINKAKMAAAFDDWQSRSEIKLLFSTLPPCETETQKEVLQGLFRSCFEAGSEAGQGSLATFMLKEMLDNMRKDERR